MVENAVRMWAMGSISADDQQRVEVFARAAFLRGRKLRHTHGGLGIDHRVDHGAGDRRLGPDVYQRLGRGVAHGDDLVAGAGLDLEFREYRGVAGAVRAGMAQGVGVGQLLGADLGGEEDAVVPHVGIQAGLGALGVDAVEDLSGVDVQGVLPVDVGQGLGDDDGLLPVVQGGDLLAAEVAVEAGQHLGDLGAGGVACGIEQAAGLAVDEAHADAPAHGVLGIVVELVRIVEVGEGITLGQGELEHGGVAVEDGAHLLAGDAVLGAEGLGAQTGHDAAGLGPAHSVVVVGGLGHVPEGILGFHLGAAGDAVEHRDQLAAGHGAVGGEGRLADAVHQAGEVDVLHLGDVPGVGLQVLDGEVGIVDPGLIALVHGPDPALGPKGEAQRHAGGKAGGGVLRGSEGRRVAGKGRGQLLAAAEGVALHGLEGLGEAELRQGGAGAEAALADVLQVLGDADLREALAVGEGVGLQPGQLLGQGDLLQGHAVGEGAGAQGPLFGAEIDGLQGRAAVEGVGAHRQGLAGEEGDRLQLDAVVHGTVADGAQGAFRSVYLGEAAALVEAIGADGGDLLVQHGLENAAAVGIPGRALAVGEVGDGALAGDGQHALDGLQLPGERFAQVAGEGGLRRQRRDHAQKHCQDQKHGDQTFFHKNQPPNPNSYN